MIAAMLELLPIESSELTTDEVCFELGTPV